MTFVQKDLSYKELLSRVHEIVCTDLNSFVFEMKALLNIEGKIADLR